MTARRSVATEADQIRADVVSALPPRKNVMQAPRFQTDDATNTLDVQVAHQLRISYADHGCAAALKQQRPNAAFLGKPVNHSGSVAFSFRPHPPQTCLMPY